LKTTKPIYLFSISSHPDAIHVNSLEIIFFKPDIDFSQYDAFIITSKQASKALQQYNTQEYLHIPALCISKQSAKSYEALGGDILAVGQGYGDRLIPLIQSYPKSYRWLYLRAEVVASDFTQKLRGSGYNIDEKIVYMSKCSQKILDVQIVDDSILIFTSPSSVACYLKTHTISQNHTVIVIGETTAKALPHEIKYTVAKTPTIQGCFETITS